MDMSRSFIEILVSFFLFYSTSAQVSERMTTDEYIHTYRIYAINEMNLHLIPASITLAQGVLETDNGNSELARMANNHFGIKCKSEWTGPTYLKDDDEKNECFRKYGSVYESYSDHSLFLATRDRYRFLFDLELTDYKAWAKGLKSAGYATNPEYANLLIKIIEEYGLHELDQLYMQGEILVINGTEATSGTSPVVEPDLIDSVASVSSQTDFRRIYENNRVKFIFAQANDSYYKIAQDFNIYTYQIPKYNEMPKKGNLKEGQVVYIERKRRKSLLDYHIVSASQTLFDIGQIYAIRTKSLIRMNQLQKDDVLEKGQILRLNKKVDLP